METETQIILTLSEHLARLGAGAGWSYTASRALFSKNFSIMAFSSMIGDNLLINSGNMQSGVLSKKEYS